jgi:hypothetical protein
MVNGGERCFDFWLRCCCVYVALAACLLLVRSANAEINVPSNVEPHKPIVVSLGVGEIPDGAKLQASCVVEMASVLDGPQPGIYHVWAKPGSYKVSAQWFVTKEISVDGVTFQALISFGQGVKSFTVGGEDDKPDPPDPVPPGTKWLVIVEESSARTPQQSNLYAAIRQAGLARVRLADQHESTDAVRRYVDLIPAGTYLPVVFVVGDDGKVFKQVALPDTLDGIKELLK